MATKRSNISLKRKRFEDGSPKLHKKRRTHEKEVLLTNLPDEILFVIFRHVYLDQILYTDPSWKMGTKIEPKSTLILRRELLIQNVLSYGNLIRTSKRFFDILMGSSSNRTLFTNLVSIFKVCQIQSTRLVQLENEFTSIIQRFPSNNNLQALNRIHQIEHVERNLITMVKGRRKTFFIKRDQKDEEDQMLRAYYEFTESLGIKPNWN